MLFRLSLIWSDFAFGFMIDFCCSCLIMLITAACSFVVVVQSSIVLCIGDLAIQEEGDLLERK